MTLRYLIPAAGVLLATLVPPDAGAIDASGPGPDIKALQQRIDQWLDGYNHGDVAQMMDVFSADFTDEMQGTPGEMDKAQVTQVFKGVFAKYHAEIDGVTDELRVSGDMAFDRGHYTVTLTPKADKVGGATKTGGRTKTGGGTTVGATTKAGGGTKAGSATTTGATTFTQHGHFLEVWRREGSTWKVQHILDMHDPAQ